MKWYKLIFTQNQPIHIGSLTWGVISETAIFIPGWTMWGALTKQYVIYKDCSIEENQKYFEKITNFYPAINQEDQLLFPAYEKGDFCLKNLYKNYNLSNKQNPETEETYSESEFRFKFVDSIMSTAVEPLSRKAKDESLHEFEYILPKSKPRLHESQIKLYWIGLIGLESDAEEMVKNFFEPCTMKVYIGADSRYGFGELKLVGFKEADESELEKWGIDKDGFCTINKNMNYLTQYLEFSPEIKFEGEIKLIADFDFTTNIPKVVCAKYYINVGSKILDFDSDKKYQLYKGRFIKII